MWMEETVGGALGGVDGGNKMGRALGGVDGRNKVGGA